MFWNKISYIGITNKEKTISVRSYILTNQINFIIFIVMVVLLIIVSINNSRIGIKASIGTYRLLIMACVNIGIFFLAKGRNFKLSKIFVVFLPYLIIILIPALLNFVEPHSFYYYPVILLGFSLLPQLIFIPKKEKEFIWIALSFYLIALIFLYDFLVLFSPEKFYNIDQIKEFLIYYKIVPLFVFFFIQVSLYYLRNLNIIYEENLCNANSSLKETLEELKQLQQNIVQTEKLSSLGALISGLSHEINNPLNYIQGGILLLNKIKDNVNNETDSDISEMFNTSETVISAGFQRINTIIKDFITLPDTYETAPVKSDINEIISNSINILKEKISDDIIIIKKYDLNNKIFVFPLKLHQAFIKIIENSVDALSLISTKKQINISTEEVENFAQITISNNGPEIPEDIIKNIFDPFFTTKDPGQGTGIGLSLCYKIIQDHNGTIKADNHKDEVRFIIKIPIGNHSLN
jgi:signal transduction histidine kinase